MNDLALSTAWNAKKSKDAHAMIDQIKQAGFNSIELYFTLTQGMVNDILPIAKKGDINVRTLHNYCPLPDELSPSKASPDYYPLSSLDEDERKKGLYHTKRTIETAKSLDADAVVLHCGRVNAKDHSRKLIGILERDNGASDEFLAMRDEMFSAREAIAKKHLDQMLKSIDELIQIADKENIMLGIENRFYFMEMPSFDEIDIVLNEFKGSSVCYWHDTGHAQVSDILGFAKHADFLERYSSRLAGVHLHDVKVAEDHLAPGQGDLDFSILKPHINSDTIRVIEAHDTASVDDLRYAKDYLAKLFK